MCEIDNTKEEGWFRELAKQLHIYLSNESKETYISSANKIHRGIKLNMT